MTEGLDGFQPHEVLELLLTYAIPQRDVNALAHSLIRHFGSFAAVLEATPQELTQVSGVGERTAAMLSMIPPLARYYERSRYGARPRLSNFREMGEYLKTLYFGEHSEVMYLLCLDTGGALIKVAEMARGTIDETPIYPRIVVESALRFKAHSVVLAHNHPAGTLSASGSDIATTQAVVNALDPIGIRVIDHIIVAGDDYISLRRQNILREARQTFGLAEDPLAANWLK